MGLTVASSKPRLKSEKSVTRASHRVGSVAFGDWGLGELGDLGGKGVADPAQGPSMRGEDRPSLWPETAAGNCAVCCPTRQRKCIIAGYNFL